MTEASRELGIVSVDKESKKGNHYMVLGSHRDGSFGLYDTIKSAMEEYDRSRE